MPLLLSSIESTMVHLSPSLPKHSPILCQHDSEGLWLLGLGREWGARRQEDWVLLVPNPLPENPGHPSGVLVWRRGLAWALGGG